MILKVKIKLIVLREFICIFSFYLMFIQVLFEKKLLMYVLFLIFLIFILEDEKYKEIH